MDDNTLKKLKKYIYPDILHIPGGLIAAAVSLFLIKIFSSWGLVGVVGGIVLAIDTIVQMIKFPSNIKKFEKEGILPQLLNDFQTGLRPFGDNSNFILGQNYIIREHEIDIISYFDIISISKNIKKDDKNGKVLIGCKITLKNNKKIDLFSNMPNEKALSAYDYICSMNPNIKEDNMFTEN